MILLWLKYFHLWLLFHLFIYSNIYSKQSFSIGKLNVIQKQHFMILLWLKYFHLWLLFELHALYIVLV